MESNRRLWLKKIGLGVAGVGLAPFQSLAAPINANTTQAATDEATDWIFLRSNENPYGPSPLAREAMRNAISSSNRYHWEVAELLIAELAKKNKVNNENMLLGAGSTEILDSIAKLAALEPGNYVMADPTYAYWTTTLDFLGLTQRKVPLTPDKKINLIAMAEAVNPATKLVYICNPNNPTGTLCDRTALIECIAKIPKNTIVVIDEAYLEFTKQESLSTIVKDYTNCIIVKTFSKMYGLAGARIGYAVASASLIEKVSQVQSNTNNSVSVASKQAAIAALQDNSFVTDCYTLNQKAREYTSNELKKLNCNCIPSTTNFIYFSLEHYPKNYFKLLEDHNIEGGRIYEEQGKWTRITVGKMEEMKKFIQALQ